MDQKLVFFEGLAGLGKSTTAHFLERQLKSNNVPVKWFHEEDDENPFGPKGLKWDNGKCINVSFFLDKYPKQLETAVKIVQEGESIKIFDSALFIWSVLLPFASNTKMAEIELFFNDLSQILEKANPLLIYFTTEDLKRHYQKIFLQRDPNNWEQRFVELFEKSPYAEDRQLKGSKGIISMFFEYQQLTNRLVSEGKSSKLIYDDSIPSWNARYRSIIQYFDIQWYSEKYDFEKSFIQYVGSYKGSLTDKEFTFSVYHGDGYLYFNFVWNNIRLFPDGIDRFRLEAWPICIQFIRNKGKIIGFELIGNHQYCQQGEYKKIIN